MSAVIYCRVSNKDKSKFSSSLSVQEEKCTKYCNDNAIQLKYCVKNVRSGRDMNNYDDIVNLINTMNKGDTFVISEISRFSRNVKKGLELLELFDNKGIHVYSVEEGITYNKNNYKHRFQFRQFLNMAEYESDQISHRISSSVKFRKDKGLYIRPKYGQKIVIEKGHKSVVANYEEKCIILKINKYIRERKKFDTIASLLNSENIKNRSRAWTQYSVKKVYKDNIVKN
jgi:DNA invertase Pin-like site-specific DNA recombinase